MITFTRTTPTVDAMTGLLAAVTTTTITGEAVQVRGDPARYAALGLTLETMPTLLFSPTEYELYANGSEFVLPGDTTVWSGETYTARDVAPIAPDGIVIAARIVIGK